MNTGILPVDFEPVKNAERLGEGGQEDQGASVHAGLSGPARKDQSRSLSKRGASAFRAGTELVIQSRPA